MIRKIEIPATAEEITTDWLTRVLSSTETIHQARVTALQIESMDGAGYSGQTARLKPDYSPAEEGAPASLIAKFPGNAPGERSAYRADVEVRFYQEFAGRGGLPTPRCYYADVDLETGNSILLLEELAHRRTVDFASGCNLLEAGLVIQHLSRFHAHWWDSPQLQTASYLTSWADSAEKDQEQFCAWWPEFPQKLKTLLPDYQLPTPFLELGHRFGFNAVKILTEWSTPPCTLIHNDTHVDNFLFGVSEGDAPLAILDWASAVYGCGVSDVTYFMTFCLPIDLRRQAERDLLQTYHRLLIEQGVQGYDFETCWNQYRHAFFKDLWVLANVVVNFDLSGPQGQSLIKAILPRVVAFSEDHAVDQYL